LLKPVFSRIFVAAKIQTLAQKLNRFLGRGIATNEKVFVKKGEFGTRQPITGAGFCSKDDLLPTSS
jgi:hypothetical protein